MAAPTFVGAAVLLTTSLWLHVHDLPDVSELVTRTAHTTTKLFDRNGRLLHEVLDPRSGRRTLVPLADTPLALRQAVVAVEDAGYYSHPGVDWRGVARAVWQASREGRAMSGGSTITQQLARTVLLSPEERSRRTLVRKLREMWLAVQISRRFSKDRVLELYLNEVYFGHLAYGVEAAAQAYFGKPARQLDLAEAALVAGLIQAPAETDPLVFVDAAKARQRVVLELMAKAGFISAAQAAEAGREVLRFTGGAPPDHAPHFVSYVLDQLEATLGPDLVQAGGLTVVTSLDLDLQLAAEDAVRRHLGQLNDPAPGQPRRFAGNAAVIALDPTSGQLLAMVGSAEYMDRRIDGAVNMALALRQPGSAFKPLTYAAAFAAAGAPARGPYPALPFTPATVLSDVPTAFTTREGEPYRPRNYDRTWHGPISLRDALATSSNMVAVKVLDAVGLEPVLGLATRLGLRSFDDRPDLGLALTLGGAEVTPLALTAAYGALANGGYAVAPVSILEVKDAPGSLPDAWRGSTAPLRDRVLPASVAYLVTDILADPQARLPAFGEGNALELYGRPAAAKTGTTSNFRDNWTVGYTPDLVVGVWVGNADNSPMRFISGISGAGPIWQAVMDAYHRGRPIHPFRRPTGVVSAKVCRATGLLASDDCPHVRDELFVAGTVPRRVDDGFVALEVESTGRLVWEPGCRGEHYTKLFRRLPSDAAAWGIANGVGRPPAQTCRGERFSLPPLELQWHRPVASTIAFDPSSYEASSSDPVDPAVPILQILEPANGATFSLVGGLDPHQQQLAIEVLAGNVSPKAEVVAVLDGREVCRWSSPPYRCFWPLTLGRHELVATGGSEDRPVTSAPAQFTVERMVVEE